jgi:hypothetical protein
VPLVVHQRRARSKSAVDIAYASTSRPGDHVRHPANRDLLSNVRYGRVVLPSANIIPSSGSTSVSGLIIRLILRMA